MTVDTGAAELALPAELVEKLRLKPLDSVGRGPPRRSA